MSRFAWTLSAVLGLACGAAHPEPPAVAPSSAPAPAPYFAPAPSPVAQTTGPIATVQAPAPPPPSSKSLLPSDPEVASALEGAEHGKTADAVSRLGKVAARVDRDGTLEDRMAMHALFGRRKRELKDTSAAAREYSQVLVLWSDPEAAVKTIASASTDDKETLVRVNQALNAAGEALFFDAEQKRATALALLPPSSWSSPSTSDAAIRRYVSTDVAEWMKKRRALEDDAASAYWKIHELRPLPPPRWVVASASQVGTMYEALLLDAGKMPIPSSIKRDPALLAAYRQALAEALAPERERVEATYRACRKTADTYRWHDAYDKKCVERLTALETAKP